MPKIPCGCGRDEDECEWEINVPSHFLDWLRRRPALVIYHPCCAEGNRSIVRPDPKVYQHKNLFDDRWVIGVWLQGAAVWCGDFRSPEFVPGHNEVPRYPFRGAGGKDFMRTHI